MGREEAPFCCRILKGILNRTGKALNRETPNKVRKYFTMQPYEGNPPHPFNLFAGVAFSSTDMQIEIPC